MEPPLLFPPGLTYHSAPEALQRNPRVPRNKLWKLPPETQSSTDALTFFIFLYLSSYDIFKYKIYMLSNFTFESLLDSLPIVRILSSY